MIKDLLNSVSKHVIDVIGEPCEFTNMANETREINAVINRNLEVFDEYGVLAGYRVEAVLMKSTVPDLEIGCKLSDDGGLHYRITGLSKETSSQYNVQLVVEDAD